MIVAIFIFSQYLFQKTLPGGKVWGYSTLLTSQFINFNHLSAYPTKWSNTLKQFFRSLPTNGLSVFDNFVRLALKGLISHMILFSKHVHLQNSGLSPDCASNIKKQI